MLPKRPPPFPAGERDPRRRVAQSPGYKVPEKPFGVVPAGPQDKSCIKQTAKDAKGTAKDAKGIAKDAKGSPLERGSFLQRVARASSPVEPKHERQPSTVAYDRAG